MLHSRTTRWIELNTHWNLKVKRSQSLHSHDQAGPVDYGPRPLKFRTKDCIHAAQTFSHLADGTRISWSRVIILVSAGFQPNATPQDYPLNQMHCKVSISQRSYRIEMKKENHLFYGIESWERQVTCSEIARMPLGPSEMDKKTIRRVPQFFLFSKCSNKTFIAIIRISSHER